MNDLTIALTLFGISIICFVLVSIFEKKEKKVCLNYKCGCGKELKTDEQFLEFARLVVKKEYDINQRPTFDEYFLILAASISLRSDDPDIKHGAVIVNQQNQIIGTGYNATVRKSNPDKIPYHIRDKKRLWMLHAEENAILNCSSNPLMLPGGAKIYVTGKPCFPCLQRMINFGITKIYHAKRVGTCTDNAESEQMKKHLIEMSGVEVIEVDIDSFWMKKAY